MLVAGAARRVVTVQPAEQERARNRRLRVGAVLTDIMDEAAAGRLQVTTAQQWRQAGRMQRGRQQSAAMPLVPAPQRQRRVQSLQLSVANRIRICRPPHANRVFLGQRPGLLRVLSVRWMPMT
jgi:hypothetical protein